MLMWSGLMSTDLGVDQLGEDEGGLEQVEHQCSQIEGRIKVPVDTEDNHDQCKLHWDLQEPEERRGRRSGASLGGGQPAVLRSTQRKNDDCPVESQVDEADDHPQCMATDVISAERDRDQCGRDHHQPDGDYGPDLTQLSDVDLSASGDTYQRGEAHEYTGDLGDRHEQDYLFHQLQPESVGDRTDYFNTVRGRS